MQVGGTIRVPGDKSLSHRALLFAALARGTSHIGGMLTSLDARSTARVLRQLGADISALGEDRVVTVRGRGRLGRPATVLNCGNSGTTTRLLLGLLAAHPFRATLTGDRSLRRRPMRRVTVPLATMGAKIVEQNPEGTLPLAIRGGRLAPLRHEMPVSSAQIKGCLLLAGEIMNRLPVKATSSMWPWLSSIFLDIAADGHYSDRPTHRDLHAYRSRFGGRHLRSGLGLAHHHSGLACKNDRD